MTMAKRHTLEKSLVTSLFLALQENCIAPVTGLPRNIYGPVGGKLDSASQNFGRSTSIV
jgi:hypothetical protein